MTWFRSGGFGFLAGGWLVFALVILLVLALCVVLLKLVFRLFKREGGTDESESDYWRIHGG